MVLVLDLWNSQNPWRQRLRYKIVTKISGTLCLMQCMCNKFYPESFEKISKVKEFLTKTFKLVLLTDFTWFWYLLEEVTTEKKID